VPLQDDEEYTGRVVTRVVNRGSKSEHRVAFLKTPAGSFQLKRPAGQPFRDPVLLRLAGSTVRCRGRVENGVLVLSDWKRLR
jgi:hypothetical protein